MCGLLYVRCSATTASHPRTEATSVFLFLQAEDLLSGQKVSHTGNKAPRITTTQQCPHLLIRNHSPRTWNVPSRRERARGTSGDPQKAPESDVFRPDTLFAPPGSAWAEGSGHGGGRAASRAGLPPCSAHRVLSPAVALALVGK